MNDTQRKNLRYYLKWAGWVLLIQLLLANISAAIYAYRFTHFYEEERLQPATGNFFSRTWKLFTGPKFYKQPGAAETPFPSKRVHLKRAAADSNACWYAAATGARSCVILLHGITTNKDYVTAEAARFLEKGFNVLLLDFRGHGQSSGHTSTMGFDETHELELAFRYAREAGNSKVIVYGVSLGAIVAMKAVADERIHPHALIADMPFDNLHNHLKTRASDVGFPSQPFAFLVTLWIGLERGYNGFSHSVSDYATAVRCPVLLQWGARDRYVNQQAIEKVYSHLAASQKKMVTYTEADHESLLRADPELWEQEVMGFLSRLP